MSRSAPSGEWENGPDELDRMKGETRAVMVELNASGHASPLALHAVMAHVLTPADYVTSLRGSIDRVLGANEAWQGKAERMRAALGEIETEIAQAMLESSHPPASLPVEDSHLALTTSAERAKRARE